MDSMRLPPPPYSTAGSAPATPDPQTGRVRQTRSHTPSSKYTAVQDGAKAEAIFEKFKAMKKAAAPAAPAMKKDLLSQALEGRYIPSGANTKAPSCPDASSFGTYSCRNHAAADASGRGTAGATESETAVTPRLRLDLAELGKPPNELRPLRDALNHGRPPLLGETSEGTEHVETSQGPAALGGTRGLVPNAREDGLLEHDHESQMVGDSLCEPVQRRDTLMEVLREEAAVTDTITIERTMVATATSCTPSAIVPHGTVAPETTNAEHPPRLETAEGGVDAHRSALVKVPLSADPTTLSIQLSYTAPDAPRYLPIFVNERFVMCRVARNMPKPISTFLQYRAGGLYFTKSRSSTDYHERSTDFAPWNVVFVGELGPD